VEAKIIKVDFSPRGKELRRLQAERQKETWEERIECRIHRAIEASR